MMDYIPPAEVAKIRTRLNLTLSQFGRLLGVSAASVSLWERGLVEPRRTNRLKLAEMLHEKDDGERH